MTATTSEDDRARKIAARRQYLISLYASLGSIMFGMALGWGSSAHDFLVQDNGPLGQLTAAQFEGLNSIVFIGAALGNALGGILIKRIGSRLGFVISSGILVIFTSTMLLPTADVSYISRLLIGMSSQYSMLTGMMYVAETCSEENRPFCSLFIQILTSSGMLIMYILGAIVPYNGLIFGQIVMSVVFFFISTILLDESPEFLVETNRREEAEEVMTWLRGGDEKKAIEEVDRIEHLMCTKRDPNHKSDSLMKHRGNYMGMLIVFGLFFCQQFCSFIPLLINAKEIYEASKDGLDPNLQVILTGSVHTLSTVFSLVIVPRYNRRTLLFISYALMGSAFCGLSIYFTLERSGWNMSHISYLPIFCLCLQVNAYCWGAGMVPYVVSIEVLSPRIRALATSLNQILVPTECFLAVTLQFVLITYVGFEASFAFEAMFCSASLLFILYVVPETRGKNLEEVLEELEGHTTCEILEKPGV